MGLQPISLRSMRCSGAEVKNEDFRCTKFQSREERMVGCVVAYFQGSIMLTTSTLNKVVGILLWNRRALLIKSLQPQMTKCDVLSHNE